jgi:oxalate decarboxylase
MTVSAAKAGSLGNPDEPAEGAISAKNPASITAMIGRLAASIPAK